MPRKKKSNTSLQKKSESEKPKKKRKSIVQQINLKEGDEKQNNDHNKNKTLNILADDGDSNHYDDDKDSYIFAESRKRIDIFAESRKKRCEKASK